MLKKMFQGMLVGAVALGMVSTANAGTFEINMYGASAQYKFWNKLADTLLADTGPNGGQCNTVLGNEEFDDENGVAKGTDCRDLDGDGQRDDIVIRYSSQASYWGVAKINVCGTTGANADMADPDDTRWGCTDPDGFCVDSRQTVMVNMGASDVAHDQFTGVTYGYVKGNKSYDGTENPYTSGPYAGLDPGKLGISVFEDQTVVVPFGIILSDSVCKFRCVSPSPYTGGHTAEGSNDVNVVGTTLDNTAGPITEAQYLATPHKAYDHFMWECDPNLSDAEGHNLQCIGHYKCIENVCSGGINIGVACDDASQCPDVDVEETRCEAIPLDNVTHTMLGQIYSGEVSDWSDFGPYFCPGPIHPMLRHEGSGTHATMRDLLKPYMMKDVSTLYDNMWDGFAKGTFIHYESSSDVTKAVCDFKGAIGYVDADKMLFYDNLNDGRMDGTWASPFGGDLDAPDGWSGCHLAKLNGVEPTRQKIAYGEYEFWAAQHVYWCLSDFPVNSGEETLKDILFAFSADSDNLATFTDFWVAQNAMMVKKEGPVANSKFKIVR